MLYLASTKLRAWWIFCWVILAVGVLTSSAQTLFWDPDQTDNTFTGNTGNWATAGNWRNNGNTANVNWTNGNIASFQVYRGYVTQAAAETVDQLMFANNSGGYRILGGGIITVNGGTDIFVRSDAFTARVENPIQMSAAASTFDMQGGGILFLTNTITAANQNLTLSADGGDIVASGVIGLGTGTLIKNGTDNLTLSAANTYTGGTTINGTGTVRVQNAAGLGTAAVALNSGTLQLENISPTNAINAANGTTIIGTGTTTTQGAITVAANGQITIATSSNPNDVFTVGTAADSLAGGTNAVSKVTISGNGTVVLGTGGGTNVYAGDYLLLSGVLQTPRFRALSNTGSTINFNGGTLEEVGNFTTQADKFFNFMAGGGRFNVQPGATANINAVNDAIIGAGTFTKGNTGTLTVGFTNNLFTGAIVVDGGTLSLNTATSAMTGASGITVKDGGIFALDNGAAANANRLGNGATLTLQGGTFQFLGAAAATTETIGATTSDVGSSTLTVQRNGANTATLTSASLGHNAGGTVNFTNGAGGGVLGGAAGNPQMVFTAAPALTNGMIGGWAYVNNADFAGYGANGVLTLAGARAANLVGGAATNPIIAANQLLAGNATVNSILVTGANTINAGGFTLNIGTGGLMQTGNNAVAITNGNLSAGAAAGAELYTNITQNTTTISANIINNAGGAINLVKVGTGTLALTGATANTYSGTTRVNEGTLSLGKTAGVNAIAGDVTVGDGNGTDTLILTASNQIADTSNVTVSRSGVFNLNGNSETINTLTMEGAYTAGTNGLVQTGAGTLTLGGNVALNATPDSTGSASITGNLALGAATRTFTVADNARVLRDMDVSAVVSGGVGLTKAGLGRLTLSGAAANTYSGVTTVNAGTLELNKTAGVNAVAGNITIATGGTLLLAANNQIANTSNMTLSGGTFNTGGFTETLGTLTLSANSTIDMGEGASVLTFSPTWTPAGNVLTINNWTGFVQGSGTDQIFFGAAKTFTDAQLSGIHFDGYGNGATQLASGEIVPIIPEASTVAAGAIVLMLAIGHRSFSRREKIG